ncbi:MAG: protein kinase [Bacteroidota bacterium]
MIGSTISHYKILEKLGEGGMGVVYKAQDTKLDRTVALKFLPAHISVNEETKARFIQEAKAAAGLNHNNICTVYGVEEHDGQMFISMEFIEGGTLRQKLPYAKTDDALNIAIQIGEALQEAHAKGIVHRDIKSDNVMLTSKGQAKVMDFGLAKLKGSLKLTRTSSTVGTLAYMAPEQIQGGEVDSRSDIFSFGVVLYEMLTGHFPFRGEHEAAQMYSILNEEPESVQRYVPEVSFELLHILKRALEKNPNERYQSLADVLIDLRRLKKDSSKVSRGGVATQPAHRGTQRSVVLGGFLLLLVASAVLVFVKKEETIDTLAILPFVNEGLDANMEYFSDGLSESVIRSLSSISDLSIRPWSSVLRYRNSRKDLKEIANELRVHGVLTGSITQQLDEYVVRVELVDVDDDRHIWGEEYRKKPSDVLVLLEEITRDISLKLQVKITGAEQKRLTQKHTVNSEAYQLYLKGRFYWNKRTPEALSKAVVLFNQALEKDPSYAQAYAGIADCYLFLPGYDNMTTRDAYSRSKEAALKALKIDDLLVEAHTSFAFIQERYDWSWADAEASYRRALEINDRYPTTHQWYGLYLILHGKSEEGIVELQTALSLDPLSLMINADLGLAYVWARLYDDAILQLRKTLEMDSSYVLTHRFLAYVYFAKGMRTEAVESYIKTLELDGYNPNDLRILRKTFHKSGWDGFWHEYIDQQLKTARTRSVWAYGIARSYLRINDRENALAWLQKAYEQKDWALSALKNEASWDDVRSDPRFIAIMKKVGLEK